MMSPNAIKWTGSAVMFAIACLGIFFHPLLGAIWFAIWTVASLLVYIACDTIGRNDDDD